jgi:hypothetical protein
MFTANAQMRVIRSIFTAACVVTFVTFAHDTLGADLSVRPNKLFAAGAKNTPPSVNAARDEYTRLKKIAGADPQLDYAYGLVLMNQGRNRLAIPLIESYVKRNDADLVARRMLLHAQMLDRQYSAALTTCVDVASCVGVPLAGDQPDELTELTEFIGTIFGYLELRGPAAFAPTSVMTARNQVISRIGELNLASFDKGRRAALSLHHVAEAAREAKLAKEQADDEQERRQAQAKLSGNRDKSGETRQTAQQSGDQLRESQREYDVVARQLLSINVDRLQIGAQITVVQSEIVALSQIQDSGTVDQRNPAPTTRTITITSYSYRSDPVRAALITALANALASLNRQALDLDRRILALQTRAGELVAAGAKASEELAESTAALAKSEKRAKNLEKQLARAERKAATKAAAAKAPAITGRMAQFSTYAPFPYEQEKERVLSWYAK